MQSLCFSGLNKTRWGCAHSLWRTFEWALWSSFMQLNTWALTLCTFNWRKIVLHSRFQELFWVIDFVFITKQQCNRESVTCNKILLSPRSSYSAPAKTPISILKLIIKKTPTNELGTIKSNDIDKILGIMSYIMRNAWKSFTN